MQGGDLPGKMNTVVQPIMASLRRETNPLLRSTAAVALAELVYLCRSKSPSPNGKYVLTCMITVGNLSATLMP